MNFLTSSLFLLLSATALALPTTPSRRTVCDGSSTTTNAAASMSGSAAAAPNNSTTTTTGINPALVPSFGVVPNTNANAQQAGSCDGFAAAKGAVVLIPCTCPPAREAFLAALAANVAAGAVEGQKIVFSNDAADTSAATQRVRGTALVVTLQNLNGPGRGCPAASAPNFAVLQKEGLFSQKVFVGPGAA